MQAIPAGGRADCSPRSKMPLEPPPSTALELHPVSALARAGADACSDPRSPQAELWQISLQQCCGLGSSSTNWRSWEKIVIRCWIRSEGYESENISVLFLNRSGSQLISDQNITTSGQSTQILSWIFLEYSSFALECCHAQIYMTRVQVWIVRRGKHIKRSQRIESHHSQSCSDSAASDFFSLSSRSSSSRRVLI